eukprot:8531482-Pyramimonas_sp.AAC.1
MDVHVRILSDSTASFSVGTRKKWMKAVFRGVIHDRAGGLDGFVDGGSTLDRICNLDRSPDVTKLECDECA